MTDRSIDKAPVLLPFQTMKGDEQAEASIRYRHRVTIAQPGTYDIIVLVCPTTARITIIHAGESVQPLALAGQ